MRAGRASLKRGAWADARQAFEVALRHREHPDALEGLALAAWWMDASAVVFDARRRAYQLRRRRHDAAGAARLAVWIAWDYSAFKGETAVTRGWLRLARELLADVDVCREHAWLAAREGVLAIQEDGDPDRARQSASAAIAAARTAKCVDYEALGRAVHGLATVAAGEVAQGMNELDAVSASILAGELEDPIAIGLSCCYLIAACEHVRDTDRAMQWCSRLRQFCTTWGLRPLMAVCRTQYASVCVWQGDWRAADEELTMATRELRASRPPMVGEGQARLGDLRRRQGRWKDAERCFDAAESHPLARLGRIALELDRGEFRRAADLAERHLRHVRADNRTARAAVLEQLVRAHVGLGRLDRARGALAELSRTIRGIDARSLQAALAHARGAVAIAARSDERARQWLEDAADLYAQCGAPFELARVRLDLARVLMRLGRADDARREALAATDTFTALDAAVDLRAARALDQSLAAAAPRGGIPRASHGLSRRELQILALIARGLPNAAIARRLFISGHTVHRHVANILTKLDVPSRAAAVAKAGPWLRTTPLGA